MNPADRYPTSDLLGSLRDLADDLGRTPTAAEYDAHGRFSRSPLRRRFGSWNAAVTAAGLDVNGEWDIGRSRLLADLTEVALDLGRTPSKREYAEHGRFAPSTHRDRFGSWKTAVHEAGLEMKGSGKPTSLERAIDAQEARS